MTRPRYTKILSVMIGLLFGGYFFSKGLMNVGFYATVTGGFICILLFDNQFLARILGKYSFLLVGSLLGIVTCEALSWHGSPAKNLLTVEIVRKEWQLLAYFLAPFPLAFVIQKLEERTQKLIVKLMIVGVLLTGLLGTLQWLTRLMGYDVLRFTTEDRAAHGLQPLALFYAYQLFPFVILMTSTLFERDGILYLEGFRAPWRMTAIFGVLLGWIGVIGSGNRAALAILIFSLPLIVLRQRPRMILSFLALAFFIGTLLLFTSPGGKRLLELEKDPGISYRAILWKAHWQTFLEKPWIGVGRRVNSQYAIETQLSEEKERLGIFTWYNAHNTYLDLLSSIGLFGLFFVLVFWITIPLRIATSDIQSLSPARRASIFSLSVALVCWAVAALTENVFDSSHARLILPFIMTGYLLSGKPQAFGSSS